MAEKEKYEVLQRLRAIEMIAHWEGRLVTSHIIKLFGISRQQASKDIKLYQSKYNPDSLNYDVMLKGYQPVSDFKPVLTKGHINEYMDMMSGLVTHSYPVTLIPDPYIAAVHVPDRSVKAEIVRPLIQACRNQSAIEIKYASMANPKPHKRQISPHTIIYTGFRWHVRGYCHLRHEYRDFVISRIKDISFEAVEDFNSGDDALWLEEIDLEIIPNVEMSEDQKTLISEDFSMSDRKLLLTLKKALVHYTLQKYQVAISASDKKDFLQFPLQLSDESESKVTEFLFGSSATGLNGNDA